MAIKCDPRAYAKCPDRVKCGPWQDAIFTEGSDCDEFNQKVINAPPTNGDRIRSMSDEELTTFLNKIVICHQLRREGYCERCPLHEAKPCDTEGIIDWLKQPAE